MTTDTPLIYLFRHCEAGLNANPRLIRGRQNESPPTERGLEQSRLLGGWLLDKLIIPDRVHSSPARRTRETARQALLAMGLLTPPATADDLQEMDQGAWTGWPRDEIYTSEMITRRDLLQKDFKAPGGESMNDVGRRMLRWLGTIPPNGTTFAFSHGVAIKCLLGELSDWSRDQIYATEMPNTALTTLARVGGQWNVVNVGLTPHLPAELVTR